MATNIEIKFYEFLDQINSLLNREIFNKPIKEWLLLAFKYSFILWFIAIGYIIFLYYQQISEVNETIKTKQRFLESKKIQQKRIILKLKDTNKAYHLAYKYLNKEKINSLKKKIDNLYVKVISTKRINYIASPIQFESFNYRLNISHNIFQDIKTVSINNLRFNSITSDYFRRFLLEKANKIFNVSKNIEEYFSINLERTNLYNFVLVAQKKSNGVIKTYISVNYPFTIDIYRDGYIVATFLPFDALRNLKFYSPLLIKWQFTVREEIK